MKKGHFFEKRVPKISISWVLCSASIDLKCHAVMLTTEFYYLKFFVEVTWNCTFYRGGKEENYFIMQAFNDSIKPVIAFYTIKPPAETPLQLLKKAFNLNTQPDLLPFLTKTMFSKSLLKQLFSLIFLEKN